MRRPRLERSDVVLLVAAVPIGAVLGAATLGALAAVGGPDWLQIGAMTGAVVGASTALVAAVGVALAWITGPGRTGVPRSAVAAGAAVVVVAVVLGVLPALSSGRVGTWLPLTAAVVIGVALLTAVVTGLLLRGSRALARRSAAIPMPHHAGIAAQRRKSGGRDA